MMIGLSNLPANVPNSLPHCQPHSYQSCSNHCNNHRPVNYKKDGFQSCNVSNSPLAMGHSCSDSKPLVPYILVPIDLPNGVHLTTSRSSNKSDLQSKDFHGRDLIQHPSETPIIPIERRTFAVNGCSRLDPRDKTVKQYINEMRNSAKSVPVDKVKPSSNLCNCPCANVTCKSDEMYQVEHEEIMKQNINQPLDLSKRKRLPSEEGSDSVNVNSGKSTLTNTTGEVKQVAATFLVDNQNNCLRSPCKTSTNVVDCVTMDTRFRPKDTNGIPRVDIFTGTGDVMSNNYHNNISRDDKVIHVKSLNQSSMCVTSQLSSPSASTICAANATMTTVKSNGGQSKVPPPPPADIRCVMLGDEMIGQANVTQEKENRKGKGDTHPYEQFTSQLPDGQGNSNSHIAFNYSNVTVASSSKCIQSGAVMMNSSSSPPPSPLRLVLPTYTQSHNSPYPDYCIVRNSVSPAVSTLSVSCPRPDPRLTSGILHTLNSTLGTSSSHNRSRSKSPAASNGDHHNVTCVKEPPAPLPSSPVISSPPEDDSPRKRRRESTPSPQSRSPSRLFKGSCLPANSHSPSNVTRSRNIHSPRGKRHRRRISNCCSNREASPSSHSSAKSSQNCSLHSPTYDVNFTTHTPQSIPVTPVITTDRENLTSNCLSSTSLSSKNINVDVCNNSSVNGKRKRSKDERSRKPLPGSIPMKRSAHYASRVRINSPNIQNTIISPPPSDMGSTRTFSAPLSPPPSPGTTAATPKAGLQTLTRSRSSDSVVEIIPSTPPPAPPTLPAPQRPPPSTSPQPPPLVPLVSPTVSPSKTKHDSRCKDSSSRSSSSYSHSTSERSSSHHSRRHHSSLGKSSSRRLSPSIHSSRRSSSTFSQGNLSPLRSPDIDDRVNRTLHIGRLCSIVRKEELRSLFSSLGGDVLNVYIKPPLPTGQPTFGFVKFSNLIDAYHAKNKFHLYKLGSTRILTGYGRINATNRVWLGNMDKKVDSLTLYKELDRFGTIVKLAHYKRAGEAVVQFETISGAESARDLLRGETFSDKSKCRKSDSHKSSRNSSHSHADGCKCQASSRATETEVSNCKSCRSKKSKAPCDEDIIVMTNESGSLETFIMSPIQVQKSHSSLWHRSPLGDKATSPNCTSPDCNRVTSFSFEKLPDDEDFTRVKKGIIVTDFIDDSPRHMIEFEASLDT